MTMHNHTALKKIRDRAFWWHQARLPPDIRKAGVRWFLKWWRGQRKMYEEYGVPHKSGEL